MFEVDELERLRRAVRDCTVRDGRHLETLRREIRVLVPEVQPIRPRQTTAVSLVASDGGNNSLLFDPFQLQVVRVVDSYGKLLCLDVVTPSQDLAALDRAQFREDGSPATALGRLMTDLDVRPRTLSELCHWMPKPEDSEDGPRRAQWVAIYRDLCEWAALYERIGYCSFGTDTLIVRDGLLTTKLFRAKYFERFRKRIAESMIRIRREDRRRLFLVGIAKRSRILTRYQMAMALEETLPPGEARFVPIPRDLEARAYNWPDQYRWTATDAEADDVSKYGAGMIYFVRFGARTGDPLWVVEVFSHPDLAVDPCEIFGYLLADARDGFPVPFYPRCLQKAHESAQVGAFDMDILQDELARAVRELLPEKRRALLDAWLMQEDHSRRRFE